MAIPRQVYAAIAALNVGLFLLMAAGGVDLLWPDLLKIISWGANVPALTLTGQAWRLLTSMFIHVGVLHLVMNTYLLVVLGGFAERTLGHLRFALVYLVSGLFGGLASAFWNANNKVSQTIAVGAGQTITFERLEPAVSAGASGALMGIAGAVLAHLMVAHARKEQHVDISMRGPLAQTIAINLGLGFMIPVVDNACHVGGLLAGALLGATLALPGPARTLAVRAAVMAAVMAASGALLYLVLQTPPSAELLALKADVLRQLARAR